MKRKFGDIDSSTKTILDKEFNLNPPSWLFDFIDLCRSINEDDPLNALKDLNLRLVGPFERFISPESKTDSITHAFFYDPPEFLTLISSTHRSGLHWGVYRDKPEDQPSAIWCNDSSVDCKFTATHASPFGLVETLLKKENDKSTNGFKESKHSLKLAKIQSSLAKFSLPSLYGPPGHSRQKNIQGKTFSGFGISVPFDKLTQVGYRELPVGAKELGQMLEKIRSAPKEKRDTKKLEEVLNWVNIGNDECDFGMGLEFGHNLFSADRPGTELVFSKITLLVLKNAYTLLGRERWVHPLEKLIDKRKTANH